jgi:integrase/recombinase XerC
MAHNTGDLVSEGGDSLAHNTGTLEERLTHECRAALAMYRAQLDAVPGLSANSRATYVDGVKRYLAWVSDPTTVLDHGNPLTDADAKRWAVLDWKTAALHGTVRTRAGGKYAASTIRATLEALNDFYSRAGLGGVDPGEVARPEPTKKAPVALRGETRRRADRILHTWSDVRDRAVIGMLRYAGVRKSEVCALDVEDVPMSARTGEVRIVGKGDKLREVPLHRILRPYLAEWLEVRRHLAAAETTPALFLGARGDRLAPRTVNNIVDRFGAAANLDPCYPHLLRDTWITELIRDRGVDIVTVAELAGHEDIETTRRYAGPNDEDRAAAVDAIDTTHLQ